MGLGVVSDTMYLTNGVALFRFNEASGEFEKTSFREIEQPGDAVYGDVQQFQYVFYQFCSRFVIQARFTYLVLFDEIRCISTHPVIKASFGWLETGRVSDARTERFCVDLTSKDPQQVEIYYEDHLQKRTAQPPPGIRERANAQFFEFISQ